MSSIRFRSAIVVFWVLAAVVRSRSLPSLSSVVEANNAQFLPASSPSQEAAQLAAPFQASNPSGTAIVIASRQGAPLTAEDRAAIARVEQAAGQVAGVDIRRGQHAGAAAWLQHRTLLVPSIARLVGRWNWPSRLARAR